MRSITRGKRRIAALITSSAAIAVSLALPASSSAATPAPSPTVVAAAGTPSQAQWKELGKTAEKYSALGVFDPSRPALVLPADASAAEKAGARAAIPAGLNISVETSRFTSDRLDKIQTGVLARKWHPEARTYGVAASYDEQTDKVLVRTDAPASALESLRDAYPGEIEVRNARIEPSASRFTDWDPFYGGGALIGSNGAACTSGYSVTGNQTGTQYMVTAAHCYPFWMDIYNRTAAWTNGAKVGRLAFRLADIDTELINGKGYSVNIFTGGTVDSTAHHFVHGTQSAQSGLKVCLSGSVTFNHCGHPISSTNVQVCYSGTDACVKNGSGFVYDRGGTNWPYYNNGTISQGGDSGSPIYTDDSTHTGAWIVGMHSGVISDCCNTQQMIGVKVASVMTALGVTPQMR